MERELSQEIISGVLDTGQVLQTEISLINKIIYSLVSNHIMVVVALLGLFGRK